MKSYTRVKSKTLWGGGLSGSHSLFEQIIAPANLFAAWRTFIRGKRWRPDVQWVAARVEDTIFALHEQLRDGTWRHGAYHRFIVSDPKQRIIHKATVLDRLVHHAVVKVIEPLFERRFIFDTWACREGKGTARAIQRGHCLLERLARQRREPVWVLKCDIRKFFASVNQSTLVSVLRPIIADDKTMVIIVEIIGSFSSGLPLGNLTSQLFANVYLDGFDHYVKEVLQPPVYVRYADDFIVADFSRKNLEMILWLIKEYLGNERTLTLHPNKIIIRPFHWGIDWLGSVLYPGYRVARPTTRKRMWQNIGDTLEAFQAEKNTAERLRAVLNSYAGLAKHTGNRHDYKKLTMIEEVFL